MWVASHQALCLILFSSTVYECKHSRWFLQDQTRPLVNNIPKGLCSFTVNGRVGSLQTSIAPYGVTFFTTKGSDHRDRSFMGKSLSLELNKKTNSPSLNTWFRILLSCHLLVLSLHSFTFSYTSSRISSNSLNYNFLFSLYA